MFEEIIAPLTERGIAVRVEASRDKVVLKVGAAEERLSALTGEYLEEDLRNEVKGYLQKFPMEGFVEHGGPGWMDWS